MFIFPIISKNLISKSNQLPETIMAIKTFPSVLKAKLAQATLGVNPSLSLRRQTTRNQTI